MTAFPGGLSLGFFFTSKKEKSKDKEQWMNPSMNLWIPWIGNGEKETEK